MIIDTFHITNDHRSIDVFKNIINAQCQWHDAIMKVCESVGFDSFIGQDFCVPDYFVQTGNSNPISRKGFFRIANDSMMEANKSHLYTLRRDNTNNTLYSQLESMSAKYLEGVGLTAEQYGNPARLGYQKAVLLKLDIPHTFDNGKVQGISQLWLLNNIKDNECLICSVPSLFSEDTKQYQLPSLPSQWRSVDPLTVISMFNEHNQGI